MNSSILKTSCQSATDDRGNMHGMGTKTNPGKFDCYDAAEPDEPMFILLGRDPAAGEAVRIWTRLRAKLAKDGDREREKVAEALACSDAMDNWARSKGRIPIADRETIKGSADWVELPDAVTLPRLGKSDRGENVFTIEVASVGSIDVYSSGRFASLVTQPHLGEQQIIQIFSAMDDAGWSFVHAHGVAWVFRK